MKTAVQILYTQDWLDIAKIVVPNTVKYCQKHGYVSSIRCLGSPYDAFEKIQNIKDLFRVGADLVFAIDCDTLITNHKYSLEEFIDYDHSFFITKDVNGINCGSFIVRKTKWAIEFLDFLLSYRGVANCEQDAVELYIADNEELAAKHIKFLPQSSINSYQYKLYPEHKDQIGQDGDFVESKSFVLHLPGISMEQRRTILSNTPIIL